MAPNHALIWRGADGKRIIGAEGLLLRRRRRAFTGPVPGIGEAFGLSAGRRRLARLQGVEGTTAPTGIVDALYAIRVSRNA